MRKVSAVTVIAVPTTIGAVCAMTAACRSCTGQYAYVAILGLTVVLMPVLYLVFRRVAVRLAAAATSCQLARRGSTR
ncbi:MAG: hypothetical protein ACYC1E_10095 [Propionibacteriaceae bacterium]